MKGDYLTIRHVDNGFTVEMNKCGNTGKRVEKVARNEAQLHAILRELFPANESAIKNVADIERSEEAY